MTTCSCLGKKGGFAKGKKEIDTPDGPIRVGVTFNFDLKLVVID